MTPRIKARIRYYKLLGRIKAKMRPDNTKGKVGCRLWRGSIRTDEWGFYQYGVAEHNGRKVPVHRVLWEEKHGPLNGKVLVNVCGNSLCVAPDHWTAVNHWTETKRGKKETSTEAG